MAVCRDGAQIPQLTPTMEQKLINAGDSASLMLNMENMEAGNLFPLSVDLDIQEDGIPISQCLGLFQRLSVY